MKTYIRKNIKGFYINFNEEINPLYWEGKIGSTYQDFLDNKWILLNDEQVEFHNNHPWASIESVITLTSNDVNTTYERTLQDAINEAVNKIKQRDNSSEINNFKVNDVINFWFTPSERSNFRNSIDSAKLLGRTEVSLFLGNLLIQIPLDLAEQMLAAIQLYADECYIVTKLHIIAVSNLETIEEVDSYDYTTGYPEVLNFNISN